MNVALLKKIIKSIKREPLRLDMHGWLRKLDPIAPCGTAGCIAGHAVVLREQKRGQPWAKAVADIAPHCFIEARAIRLLRLTTSEARRLFYSENWPGQFQIAGYYTMDALEREHVAAITVKRIEHFIKTKGRE